MAWTYSGDPRNSKLDEVRFLIADTDQNKAWTLLDGEIQYAVSLYPGSVLLAAAICAESIIAKLKGTVGDKKVGPLSLTYSQQTLQFYQQTALNLRRRADLGVGVWIGGTSKSGKQTRDDDDDLVQLKHKIDSLMHTSTETDSGSES